MSDGQLESKRRKILSKRLLSLCCLALIAVPLSSAAFLPNSEELPEQVIMLKTQTNPQVLLETTIYKPDGPGPFPLVVMNHGSIGHPREQRRDRPLSAAGYFLERGYMVAVPMRQGFSKSTGSIDSHGCDVQSEALAHAEDIRAALMTLEARPDVDARHVLLVGHSYGGMATLAAASQPLPGVRGTVIFAGVIRVASCWNWPVSLIDASAHFGRTSRAPSLWFYGSNDHYIAEGTARSMAAAYERAGGYVRLVTYPDFQTEGHWLFYQPAGRETWEKPLTDFLAETGMPHEVTHPEYSLLPLLAIPAATHFAALDDVGKLPLVGDQGRQSYRDFLAQSGPRAFAISGDGASGWLYGHRDNPRGALQQCSTYAQKPCFLYAVDSTVVWDPKNLPQPAARSDRILDFSNSNWLQLVLITAGLVVVIFNVVRAVKRLRYSLDGSRTIDSPRASVRTSQQMRVTKTGIVWGLVLIAIPAAIFVVDPLSPWFLPLKGNARLVIFGLFLIYWLGGQLLKALGYPIGHIITPAAETAVSLTAKAVKKGYRR